MTRGSADGVSGTARDTKLAAQDWGRGDPPPEELSEEMPAGCKESPGTLQGAGFSTLQSLAAGHLVCSCHCTAEPLDPARADC